MATETKSAKKYVYVFLMEHYYFPKEGDTQHGDMVACTPKQVCAGTDTGRITLKTLAKKAAKRMCEMYDTSNGEVKEFDSGNEYRVWIDWPKDSLGYVNADRFVWVVRRSRVYSRLDFLAYYLTGNYYYGPYN